MLGIMDELVDEGLGQFYDNYVDKSMRFFINPINWSVLSIQRLLGILFVEYGGETLRREQPQMDADSGLSDQ
ncbi:hypothetical protein OIU76_006968 [Salix suchowensis]|nr:hypothetical protein OIU76_006968 [Salix suchowensis]